MPDLQVLGQHEDAFLELLRQQLVVQPQFLRRADHALRLDAAQFRLLDLDIARQLRPDKRHRNFLPGGDIRRAAHDLQDLARAGIHRAHAQLVRIRVLFLLLHMADDDAFDSAVALFHDIDLDAAARQLLRQIFAPNIRLRST